VAGTRFTASALDVEREAARLIAAHARFRKLRKKVAQMREQAGVGRRVGAWCTADRRLVDVDHLVEQLPAVELLVCSRFFLGIVEALRQSAIQSVDDQRA